MRAETDGAGGSGSGRTAGVVLAAGRSVRMGEPKALLEVGGRTFLSATVSALLDGGCSPVVVVVAGDGGSGDGGSGNAGSGNAGAEDAVARAARGLPVTVVGNTARGSEQLDSILRGLDALPRDVDGAVVLPVDHPLVRPGTVAALIRSARSSPDAVVRPTCAGRPGHPTLFPRSVWPRLREPGLPDGARSVVESPDTRTVDVPVDDGGIRADIDTPADYSRHVGRGSGGV